MSDSSSSKKRKLKKKMSKDIVNSPAKKFIKERDNEKVKDSDKSDQDEAIPEMDKLDLLLSKIGELEGSMIKFQEKVDNNIKEMKNEINGHIEEEPIEDLDKIKENDNKIVPDLYTREAKFKFAFAEDENPQHYKMLMNVKKEVINEFISYRDQISEAAFFNFVWYRTIMICLKYVRQDDSFYLLLLQTLGALSDATYLAAKAKNFKQGEAFFERVNRAKGAISIQEYFDIFTKSVEKEEKIQRKKAEKIKKKCIKCGRFVSGKHFCKQKKQFNSSINVENNSGNNQNNGGRRRAPIVNQMNTSSSNINNN